MTRVPLMLMREGCVVVVVKKGVQSGDFLHSRKRRAGIEWLRDAGVGAAAAASAEPSLACRSF